MRRSRAALTLFLGSLAMALHSVGIVSVQPGMATEPVTRLCCIKGAPVDCYAGAPDSFDEEWYLETCKPDYECYGCGGADCLHETSVKPAVQSSGRPVNDYCCEWECEIGCEGEHQVVAPRVHLEDISYLTFDLRHSSGQDEVLRMNRENEGLQAASLSTGDLPRDLPAGEAFYVWHIAHSEIAQGFDYDEVYHDNTDYNYCESYGVTGRCTDEYELPEPSDLPPGEKALHVATPAPVYNYNYEDDYEDESSYDYSSQNYRDDNDESNYDYSGYNYGDDEEGYVYNEYSAPIASSIAPAALPTFIIGTTIEPGDLPLGERFVGDLPPGELMTDDLPAGEEIADDMPPGETIIDMMPVGEEIDDLPPAEFNDDLPPGEAYGEAYLDDYKPHTVYSSDLPPAEDISDLPPAETGRTAPAVYDYNDSCYCDYGCGYNYGCDRGYTVKSYGCDAGCHQEYEGYGDCDAWQYRHDAQATQPVAANYSGADAAGTLRPILRTASWLLGNLGDALRGLSKSCDQMAGEENEESEGTVIGVPPEMEYPWPSVIGRPSDDDEYLGL